MNFYTAIVCPDTRWPVGPAGPVLKITTPKGNSLNIGFWNEEEFTRWMNTRSGQVIDADGDVRTVLVQLTKKEATAYVWDRS